MIARELFSLANRHAPAPAIITTARTWSYSQLANAANWAAQSLDDRRHKRLGVWCHDLATLVATLMAMDSLDKVAVLVSAGLSVDQVRKMAEDLQLEMVVTDRPMPTANSGDSWWHTIDFTTGGSGQALTSPTDSTGSEVILFTSGTSGRPKPAVHTWETLSSSANRDPRYHGRRWLLAYDPTSFAGIQVWLQALLTGGCVCVWESSDPASTASFLLREHVEFASATPSFWRLLLVGSRRDDLAGAALVQITLGGEAVDQSILDALHATFPRARITHIYASTEMGVCFSVSDGLAGFPATYLTDETLPCHLRMSEEGELEIRSGRAMLGYLRAGEMATASTGGDSPARSEWFATGDLVELRDGRVYFIGRRSETINVGGAKVYPADVEACIRGVPGVEQVRVFAVRSSLTGQLVGAEVQGAAGLDHNVLRANILTACRQRLSRHQVPSTITFRDRLILNASGKLTRGEVLHGA